MAARLSELTNKVLDRIEKNPRRGYTLKPIEDVRDPNTYDTHIESLDGFDIYQTPQGKFYAVLLWSGTKSFEFETLFALTTYFGI